MRQLCSLQGALMLLAVAAVSFSVLGAWPEDSLLRGAPSRVAAAPSCPVAPACPVAPVPVAASPISAEQLALQIEAAVAKRLGSVAAPAAPVPVVAAAPAVPAVPALSLAAPSVFTYLGAAARGMQTEAEALAAAQADARALPAGAAPECAEWLSALSRRTTFTSQFGQDATIYYSFLAGKLARGEHGVYVDVGPNQPRHISNTWFLDRCLGWSGLCIEADPVLAEGLRASERTCKVVNKCASDRAATLSYVTREAQGHVAREGEAGSAQVPCAPLSEVMLAEGFARADFLSIDIEGNEVTALSNSDWDAIDIQMILIESIWSNEQLDMLLSDAGYWRTSDLAYIDDLYIRGPRLLHDPVNQANERKVNWDYALDIEKKKKRSIKREAGYLNLDATGNKVVYTGMGGFNIGGDSRV